MADMQIQSTYNRYQQKGYPGQIAYPSAPTLITLGKAGEALRPGWGVVFDGSAFDWKRPANDNDRQNVAGIVSYTGAVVQDELSSVPTGANSPFYVEYDADSQFRLVREGVVWLLTGGVIDAESILEFRQTQHDWVTGSAISDDATSLYRAFVYALEPAAGAGEIIAARIVPRVR